MKTLTMTTKAILVTSLVLLFAIAASVHASSFRQIPFEFEDYSDITLDWADSNKDDSNTGSTALGFSVTIGGAAYSYFDMCIDGYIELLTDACDTPTAYGCGRPTGCGWGRVDDLIYDEPNGADPNATYLLAAYGDFDSTVYGYYGYKLFSDRAVFYYDTETYQDGWPLPDPAQLNNFEVILYDDGNVQWNFNSADYELFDQDLFSGLYLGNTQTLLELTIYNIPEQKSYLYYGCDDWLTLDFDNDCIVHWADLGHFAHQWLQCAELNDPNCTEDRYTLTINTVGSGFVTKTPGQATYTYGTIVYVNAITYAGWTFSAWSGDLSGSNNPETIIMDGNKNVTATFTEDQ